MLAAMRWFDRHGVACCNYSRLHCGLGVCPPRASWLMAFVLRNFVALESDWVSYELRPAGHFGPISRTAHPSHPASSADRRRALKSKSPCGRGGHMLPFPSLHGKSELPRVCRPILMISQFSPNSLNTADTALSAQTHTHTNHNAKNTSTPFHLNSDTFCSATNFVPSGCTRRRRRFVLPTKHLPLYHQPAISISHTWMNARPSDDGWWPRARTPLALDNQFGARCHRRLRTEIFYDRNGAPDCGIQLCAESTETCWQEDCTLSVFI